MKGIQPVADHRQRALNEVEEWVEGTLQQLERIAEAMRGGAFFTWGSEGLRFSADQHFLVVAAEHLRKALEAAPKSLGLPTLSTDVSKGVEVLRDVFEHRDSHLRDRWAGRQPRRAAGRLLAAGSDNPFKTTWGPEEFTIGGVLPVNALASEVLAIQALVAQLRQDIAAEGETPADPTA